MSDVLQDTDRADQRVPSTDERMGGTEPVDHDRLDEHALATPDQVSAGPQLLAAGAALVSGLVLWPFNCDDAAISFRFAEQFANGAPLGTVVPGDAVVSGFSNPVWTLLLSGASWIGLPITGAAKVLGLVAVMATAVLVVRIVALLGGGRIAQWSAAAVGASTTTAIWAVSGLENASVGLLVVATTYLLILGEVRSSRRSLGGAAATLALLAVSRPDAAVYVMAGSVAALLARRRSTEGRHILGPIALWLAVPMAVLAAWTWFSLNRFGHPLPNTYYAKVDTPLVDRLIHPVESMREPLRGTWVFALSTVAVGLVPALVVGIQRRWRGPASTALLFLLASLALPLSERDWMLDHRFFTASVPLLLVFVALGVEDLWLRREGNGTSSATRVLGVASVAGLVLWTVANVQLTVEARLAEFEGQVTTESIAHQARLIATVADHHGVHDPLVLTADAGATIFDEQLRLVDMAGLVDPQIGQLMQEPDRRAEYAFAERRPDVIRTSTPEWNWYHEWQFGDAALRRAGYIETRTVEEPMYIRRDRVVRPASTTTGALRVDGLEVPAAVDGGRVTVRAWLAGLDGSGGDEVRFRLARPTGAATTSTRPVGDLLDPGSGWNDDEAVLHLTRLDVPQGSGPLTLTVTTTSQPTIELGRARISEGASAAADAAGQLTDHITTPEDADRRLTEALDLADAAPNNRDVTEGIAVIRRIGRELALQQLVRSIDATSSSEPLEQARRRLPTLRGRQAPSPAEADAARAIHRVATSSVTATSAEHRYRLVLVAWTLDPRPADIQSDLLDARAGRPSTNPLRPEG